MTRKKNKGKEERESKSLAKELKKQIEKDKKDKEKESKKKKKEKEVSEKEKKEGKITTEKESEEKEIEKKETEKKETLIPLEDYIKCVVHLGTKAITPHMRKYVYKRRADGLAVINTLAIDEKLKEAIEFLSQYEPEDIYLVCKREAGWDAANKFGEATRILVFTKSYPPGITTNLSLDNFFEKEVTIICDPWVDKNALNDTVRLKKPVVALCDTNNFTFGVTKVIPCNNKSRKSLGCILYILAREYAKRKGFPFNYKMEDFTGPLD